MDSFCRTATRLGSVSVFLASVGGLCIVCFVFVVEIQVVINIFQKVDTFTWGNTMSRFHAHAKFAREWKIPNVEKFIHFFCKFFEEKKGKSNDWEEVENW